MSDSLSAAIQEYYNSAESKFSFRYIFGGSMHLGYYASPNSWPLPLGAAFRRMEAKLVGALQKMKKGSKVLDAGCGEGIVALYVAQQGGFRIEGIDVTPYHITKSRQNIGAAGMSNMVSIQQGDYHNLENFKDADFDGVYTMESLVHSPQRKKVLQEFLRVLKPGGCLVLHEYDETLTPQPAMNPEMAKEARFINKHTGVPEAEETEVLEEVAREVGFANVESTDMSQHIVPFLWLFYLCAYIPYRLVKIFGLQFYFVNLTYAVGNYRSRNYWRYIQLRATKPL